MHFQNEMLYLFHLQTEAFSSQYIKFHNFINGIGKLMNGEVNQCKYLELLSDHLPDCFHLTGAKVFQLTQPEVLFSVEFSRKSGERRE